MLRSQHDSLVMLFNFSPLLKKKKKVHILSGQYFYFQLKEEYAEKLVPDASQVEVGVTCDSALRKVEAVDWETGALTLSEETFGKLVSKIFENWTQKPNLDFSETFSAITA